MIKKINLRSSLKSKHNTNGKLSPSAKLALKLEVSKTHGQFGWSGEGGGVEGSIVELAKNKLILC